MNYRGMGCCVFLESLDQEYVNGLRLIVGDLLVSKALVEMQEMAGRTVARITNGAHVCPGFDGLVLFTGCSRSRGSVRSVRPGLGAQQTMAVVTGHLHSLVAGTNEIGLQMQVVVEPDRSCIDLACGKR